MDAQRKTEEEIFDEALRLENLSERQKYVSKACAGDPDLLANVRALLGYHDSNSFLDAPVFEPDLALSDSPSAEGPGTVIGPYKLLELIGEGGFGAVYMAEQEKPIRRRVALKIIKLGMDTKQVVGRFEAERQALAMMDHPNIAKVFEAGPTDIRLDRSAKQNCVHLTLRWRGGAISELDVALPNPHQPTIKTGEKTIDLLRRLACHYDDATIAGILNRQGRRTAMGERFTANRVAIFAAIGKSPAISNQTIDARAT